MTFRRVRMELARNHDFPDGSPNHGYEITLPLTQDSRFDPTVWETDGQLCTFVKFSPDDDDAHGQFVRMSDGQWAFSYEAGEADDEPVFRFESHLFQPGEYVTVTDVDEHEHVYRIMSAEPLKFPSAT